MKSLMATSLRSHWEVQLRMFSVLCCCQLYVFFPGEIGVLCETTCYIRIKLMLQLPGETDGDS